MNLLHRIHHKAKPAIIFLVVMLIVLGTSMVEKRLMHDMNTSVTSLYKDRLHPATGLFQLNDLMYAKRQLLEQYLAQPQAQLRQHTYIQIAGRNVQIDSLISRYESTYLVAEENRVFGEFKANLRQYNEVEKQLLSASAAVTPADAQKLNREFDAIHGELARLSQIQLQVGQELSDGSAAIEGNATLLSNVQIALVVLLTLAIQQALLLDRHPLVPKSLKNFRLN
ncbi:MCP four helix bundle domain-containing protein [Hymenobacter koreensis]|uniref:Chemotaxis methyl-accepting receptor HlyB-like 4HB MCP domain-containing protein n=1 Tax=Hymenobacter koreensis TaxID=1084523 RepID=A0ABP8JM34_9BACT